MPEDGRYVKKNLHKNLTKRFPLLEAPTREKAKCLKSKKCLNRGAKGSSFDGQYVCI